MPRALELAEDLQRYLAGEPIRARPVGPVERSWRWCRAHPSGAALILVAAMAAITVLTIALTYDVRPVTGAGADEVRGPAGAEDQDRLHHTLTQQVADRLDGDLRELAAVPLTMATLLENRSTGTSNSSRRL